MDSSFHPHKFHPTRYAEDPYDLLITPKKLEPRFTGICTCVDESHPRHKGKPCTVLVERDAMPFQKKYRCYDCDREKRNARDRERTKQRHV